MHCLSLTASLVEIAFQIAQSHCLRNAYGRCFLAECRLDTRPDDIIDGQIITEDDLCVSIYIDDGGQAGIVKTEKIQKCGVLTEAIGIVGIVDASLVIAQEEQQPAAHVLL